MYWPEAFDAKVQIPLERRRLMNSSDRGAPPAPKDWPMSANSSSKELRGIVIHWSQRAEQPAEAPPGDCPGAASAGGGFCVGQARGSDCGLCPLRY